LQGDDDAVPIFKGVRKEDDDDEEEEEEGERTRAPEEAMEEERRIVVIIIRGVRFFVSRTFQVPRESVEFCKRSRKNGELENHHHFLGRRHKRYKKKSQIKVA